jgi:aspartyl-tRNA(Asn)/glutamyl-tRNA(Gln) amidotransferase subunit C
MMTRMERADIEHLAELARIAITDEEAAALAAEFDAILGYVVQVQEVSASVSALPAAPAHRNVFREDVVTEEAGAYTEALLSAAPNRNGAYIEVKKILEK